MSTSIERSCKETTGDCCEGQVATEAAAAAAASSPGDTQEAAAAATLSVGATAVGAGATVTVTMAGQRTASGGEGQIMELTLVNRPGVTWDQNVIDNEGLGRKSSKRCCIFHKARPFGESSTDTSDYDSDNENNNRKIARKKLPGKKKTPDHLRFHA